MYEFKNDYEKDQARRKWIKSCDDFCNTLDKLKTKLNQDLDAFCESDTVRFNKICEYGEMLKILEDSFSNEYALVFRLFKGEYANAFDLRKE